MTDKQSDIVAELRECPFCGTKATIEDFPGEGEWTIRCVNGACWATIHGHDRADGAIAAWNTRVNPAVHSKTCDSAADELERLRAVCRTNIGTLDWMRQRLIEYGKPHGEIDCAIEETERALSHSATKEPT